MKKWAAVLVMAAVCLLGAISVGATPTSIGAIPLAEEELDPSHLDFGQVDEVLKESGADEVLEEQTGSRTIGELLEALLRGEGSASWSEWLSAFGRLLTGNLKEYLGLMLQVIALTLLSQIFSAMDVHFGEGSAAAVGFLAVYGVLIWVLVRSFQLCCEETAELVEVVKKLSLYMFPAMAAVAAAGGYAVSGVLQSGLMTTGFGLILTLMKDVFITGVLWVTVIELVNFISKRAVLSQLTGLIKTLLEKGIKGVSGLYLLLMGAFGFVMPSVDQTVYKASSAVMSSVPVVGSALSGAMDTVLAGSLMIKNGIGTAGCLSLLCVCLIPAARLTAVWLVYRLLAAFLSPVADDRVVQGLRALSSSTAMLLGLLVSSMVIFTGAVGIFVMTTGR